MYKRLIYLTQYAIIKNMKSFLERRQKERNFDAFNVINIMLLMGVLVAFIISAVFCIVDLVDGTETSAIPLIERLLAIVLLFLPLYLRLIFKIQFPRTATSLFYLFLFLSIYLGNFIDLFNKFWWWDLLVHFSSGLLLGFLAMFFVNHLAKKGANSPIYVFLFVFCFSVALAGIWEIYEFMVDVILDMDMQHAGELVGQSALFDTMFDLISSTLGAIISALCCAVLTYKDKNFVLQFRVAKIKKNKISQIEE